MNCDPVPLLPSTGPEPPADSLADFTVRFVAVPGDPRPLGVRARLLLRNAGFVELPRQDARDAAGGEPKGPGDTRAARAKPGAGKGE